MFDSPSRDESLHQSYRNEQSDCWHWQGEWCSGQWNQLFQLDYSLLSFSQHLSYKHKVEQRKKEWKNTMQKWKVCCVIFFLGRRGTEFLSFLLMHVFVLCRVTGLMSWILTLYWVKGLHRKTSMSQRQRHLSYCYLSHMLHNNYYLAQTVFARSMRLIYLWFPVSDLAVSDYTALGLQP